MKKIIKISLIIFLAGILVSIIGLVVARLGSSEKNLFGDIFYVIKENISKEFNDPNDEIGEFDDNKMQLLEDAEIDGITSIDIEAARIKFEVKKGDKDSYQIYAEDEKALDNVEIKFDNNELKIKEEQEKNMKIKSLRKIKIVVNVKEDKVLEKIKTNLDIARVKLTDVKIKKYDGESDIVDITLENTKIEKYNEDISVGNLSIKDSNLEDVEIDGDVIKINVSSSNIKNIKLESSVGNIYFKDSKIKEVLQEIEATNTTYEDCIIDKIKLDAESSNITLSGEIIDGNFKFEASNYKLLLNGERKDYNNVQTNILGMVEGKNMPDAKKTIIIKEEGCGEHAVSFNK